MCKNKTEVMKNMMEWIVQYGTNSYFWKLPQMQTLAQSSFPVLLLNNAF